MHRCEKNYGGGGPRNRTAASHKGADQDAFLFSCCPTLHMIKGGAIKGKNEFVIRLISHRAFK